MFGLVPGVMVDIAVDEAIVRVVAVRISVLLPNAVDSTACRMACRETTSSLI